jgi:hypothetical protein
MWQYYTMRVLIKLPPKVGNPQIAYPQICYICGSSANVTLCGFAICRPNLFCDFADLNASTSTQIHTFSPYRIKCSNNNLYIIKKPFNKTTTRKGLRQSVKYLLENCELAYLRKLQIGDSGMSPRICGFADLRFAFPPVIVVYIQAPIF